MNYYEAFEDPWMEEANKAILPCRYWNNPAQVFINIIVHAAAPTSSSLPPWYTESLYYYYRQKI